MPLARIVTSDPDEVASLCQHLRSLGFTVEVVEPTEGTLGCDPHVTENTDWGRRVIAYDITGRAVEFEEEEPEAVAGSSAFAEVWQRLRSAKGEIAGSLRLSFSHLGKLLADGRSSLDGYRTRYQQLRTQAAAQAEESRRERRAQRQAFKAERSRRRLEQERRKTEMEALRERMPAETREYPQEVRLAEVALPEHEPLRVPYRYRRDIDLQKAAVAAAALALLAIVGFGAYRKSLTTPLSHRDLVRSQDVSQPVPFAVATAPVQGSATETVVNVPFAHRVSLPQSDAAAKANAVPRVARKRLVRRARTEDGDIIGEDRVIIHHLSSGTVQARANRHPGLKRISDLD